MVYSAFTRNTGSGSVRQPGQQKQPPVFHRRPVKPTKQRMTWICVTEWKDAYTTLLHRSNANKFAVQGQWELDNGVRPVAIRIKMGLLFVELPFQVACRAVYSGVTSDGVRFKPIFCSVDRLPDMCYKCHGFNHRQNECPASTWSCRLCSGPHWEYNCTSGDTRKCANCHGPHESNWRGCPHPTAVREWTRASTRTEPDGDELAATPEVQAEYETFRNNCPSPLVFDKFRESSPSPSPSASTGNPAVTLPSIHPLLERALARASSPSASEVLEVDDDSDHETWRSDPATVASSPPSPQLSSSRAPKQRYHHSTPLATTPMTPILRSSCQCSVDMRLSRDRSLPSSQLSLPQSPKGKGVDRRLWPSLYSGSVASLSPLASAQQSVESPLPSSHRERGNQARPRQQTPDGIWPTPEQVPRSSSELADAQAVSKRGGVNGNSSGSKRRTHVVRGPPATPSDPKQSTLYSCWSRANSRKTVAGPSKPALTAVATSSTADTATASAAKVAAGTQQKEKRGQCKTKSSQAVTDSGAVEGSAGAQHSKKRGRSRAGSFQAATDTSAVEGTAGKKRGRPRAGSSQAATDSGAVEGTTGSQQSKNRGRSRADSSQAATDTSAVEGTAGTQQSKKRGRPRASSSRDGHKRQKTSTNPKN